jgi:prepilin-type N-terminal cleavage/methylation domain-containing protein
MTRIRSRRTPRYAFTLIELLVVIAIIAVLVSLSAAGIMKILNYVPQVQTRTDIGQMDAALGAFMADYQLQDPPPSYLILREDMNYLPHYTDPGTGPIEVQSHQFLKRLFGKNLGPTDWNQNGKIDVNIAFPLEGEQCLVFYLGGVQAIVNGSPTCLGFSTNATNPAAGTTSRKGPYFNFLSSRLVPGTTLNKNLSAFFVYLDPWKPDTGVKMPYAYFSSYGINNKYNPFTAAAGGDCLNIAAYAYYDGGSFTNPNKYQVISAGQDGIFGFNPGPTPLPSSKTGLVNWSPSSGALGNGRDDQANFSSKLLGAGQS